MLDFSNLKILGISFTKQSLLKQAFTHRSYLNEAKRPILSNERLEFLGDSILSYIVSEHLYKTYSSLSEGELTNLRSSIVKTSTLAGISKNLKLGEYLYLSRGEEESGGRVNPSILADTFEALLGAIYLDQGLKKVQEILQDYIFPLLPQIIKEKAYRDAKSYFQEQVQEKSKVSPIYKVIRETGPDHAKEFTVGVYVDNVLWGQGVGKSKQEAEQEAAKAALEKWKEK